MNTSMKTLISIVLVLVLVLVAEVARAEVIFGTPVNHKKEMMCLFPRHQNPPGLQALTPVIRKGGGNIPVQQRHQ